MMILKEKINKNELIGTMVNQLNLFLESHNRLIELAEKKEPYLYANCCSRAICYYKALLRGVLEEKPSRAGLSLL